MRWPSGDRPDDRPRRAAGRRRPGRGAPADARRRRAGRQQGSAPRDPVPRPVRRAHRAVAGSGLGGLERHLRGGEATGPDGPSRSTSAARCSPASPALAQQPDAAGSYEVVTETAEVAEPALGRRHPVPVHVVRAQLHGLHGDGDHPHRDDRRRRGRDVGAHRVADPQARRGVVRRHAHVHHRVPRRHLEHRVGCRLPGAHPARRGGLQERRPSPAGRHGGCLRRGGRRLRRQPARHARPTPCSPRSRTRPSSSCSPDRSIDITANLYFGIGSTIVLTVLLALVTHAARRAAARPLRPGARTVGRRAARTSPTRSRASPRSRTPGASGGPASRSWPPWPACWRSPCRRAPRCGTPVTGSDHRHVAVHGQPDRHHRAAVPGGRTRLRARRRHADDAAPR